MLRAERQIGLRADPSRGLLGTARSLPAITTVNTPQALANKTRGSFFQRPIDGLPVQTKWLSSVL